MSGNTEFQQRVQIQHLCLLLISETVSHRNDKCKDLSIGNFFSKSYYQICLE